MDRQQAGFALAVLGIGTGLFGFLDMTPLWKSILGWGGVMLFVIGLGMLACSIPLVQRWFHSRRRVLGVTAVVVAGVLIAAWSTPLVQGWFQSRWGVLGVWAVLGVTAVVVAGVLIAAWLFPRSARFTARIDLLLALSRFQSGRDLTKRKVN